MDFFSVMADQGIFFLLGLSSFLRVLMYNVKLLVIRCCATHWD